MYKLSVFIPLVIMWFSFSSTKEKGKFTNDRCESGIDLTAEDTVMKYIQHRFDQELTSFHGIDFGNISVKFRVDSLHRLYSVRLVQVVHPTFDSLVLASLNELDSGYFPNLNTECNYLVTFYLGSKKTQSEFDALRILMADGNYKRSIDYAMRLLKKSPTNAELLYYLGRAQIGLGNPEGRKTLIKAARMGDEDAYQYLLGEE
ncbi:MAG: tetratricopeptide repeat protein [Fluviicola sp.]|nr:tetratricopeptide repeat protein [Fluviicola sp.]